MERVSDLSNYIYIYVYLCVDKKIWLTLPFVASPIGIGVNWLRHVNGYWGHTNNNKTEQKTETELEMKIETDTETGTGSEIV